MSLSYFSLSCVDTFPLPRNTMAGLTVCLPSALIQSCRVACLLSRPEPGWETQICLLPEKSYVLSCSTTKGRGTWSTLNLCFGIHRPYFLSGTALLLLLLDLTAFLKFLPCARLSLNSATRSFVARGYLSLFLAFSPTIFLLCRALTPPALALRLLSDKILSLALFHFITRHLLICFASATFFLLFLELLKESRRWRVCFLNSTVYDLRVALPRRLSWISSAVRELSSRLSSISWTSLEGELLDCKLMLWSVLSWPLHSDGCLNLMCWSRYCFPKKDRLQIPHRTESYFSLTAFGSVAVTSSRSPFRNSTFCWNPQSNRVRFIIKKPQQS